MEGEEQKGGAAEGQVETYVVDDMFIYLVGDGFWVYTYVKMYYFHIKYVQFIIGWLDFKQLLLSLVSNSCFLTKFCRLPLPLAKVYSPHCTFKGLCDLAPLSRTHLFKKIGKS